MAISRSWVSASIAAGRAPSAARQPVQPLVEDAARCARSASGTRWRPGTGRRARARRPAVSAPASGWPPMKRGSSIAARRAPRLVEPTSVTTQSVARGRERLGDQRRQRAAPARTTKRGVGAVDRVRDESQACGRSRRARARPRARAARRVEAARPRRPSRCRARPGRSSRRSARRRGRRRSSTRQPALESTLPATAAARSTCST